MGKKIQPNWAGFDAAELGRRRWRVGPHIELDEHTRELWVGGQPTPVEPKALDCFIALLRHPDGLVTKTELIRSVWNGRPVTESVITKAFAKLRLALSDHAQACVKTLHGHGYRLLMPASFVLPNSNEGLAVRRGEPLASAPNIRAVKALAGNGLSWRGERVDDQSPLLLHFAQQGEALLRLKQQVQFARRAREHSQVAALVEPLVDWSLEKPPCFVALQLLAREPMMRWFALHGGLEAHERIDRLTLMTRIVEAVAMLHEAGLSYEGRLQPDCIGLSLGEQPLAAARLVMLAHPPEASVHMGAYVAPELEQGGGHEAADVYALGAMLHQMMVGRWSARLTPGWHLKVEDECLRRLIWDATNQEVAHRLPSARALHERLLALPAERAALEAQQRQQAEIEVARLAAIAHQANALLTSEQQLKTVSELHHVKIARLRQRSLWLISAVVLLGIGGALLHSLSQQQQLTAALKLSQQQSSFITETLLSGTDSYGIAFWNESNLSHSVPVESLALTEHVVHAREQFASKPAVLAQVLENVGDTLRGLNHYREAALLQAEGAALSTKVWGAHSPQRLSFLRKRGYSLIEGDLLTQAIGQGEELLRLAKAAPARQGCLAEASGQHVLGWAHSEQGQITEAATHLAAAKTALATCEMTLPQLQNDITWDLAQTALDQGRWDEAVTLMQEVHGWYVLQGRNKASSLCWANYTLFQALLAKNERSRALAALSEMRGIAATLPRDHRANLLAARSQMQWLLVNGEAVKSAELGRQLDARLVTHLGETHQWRLRNFYWTSRAELAAGQTAAALKTAQQYFALCAKSCLGNTQWLDAASTLLRAQSAASSPLSVAAEDYQRALVAARAQGLARWPEWALAGAPLQPAQAAKVLRQQALAQLDALYGDRTHWTVQAALQGWGAEP